MVLEMELTLFAIVVQQQKLHFLLQCQLYQTVRSEHLHSSHNLDPTIKNLSNEFI